MVHVSFLDTVFRYLGNFRLFITSSDTKYNRRLEFFFWRGPYKIACCPVDRTIARWTRASKTLRRNLCDLQCSPSSQSISLNNRSSFNVVVPIDAICPLTEDHTHMFFNKLNKTRPMFVRRSLILSL